MQKIKVNDSYQIKMDALKYQTEYIFEIIGRNAKDDMIEGKTCSYVFTTPQCSEINEYNLEKCSKDLRLNEL